MSLHLKIWGWFSFKTKHQGHQGNRTFWSSSMTIYCSGIRMKSCFPSMRRNNVRHSKVFMKGNYFHKQTLNILGKCHNVLHCLLANKHTLKILQKYWQPGKLTTRAWKRNDVYEGQLWWRTSSVPSWPPHLPLSTGLSACTMSTILKCKWR